MIQKFKFSDPIFIHKTKKIKNSPFVSHNVRPLPVQINSTTLRVFFASRLKDDIPSPNYVDVDINNPEKIKKINKKKIINLGKLGSFDADGITFTQIIPLKKNYLIQYSGWKRSRYKMTIDMGIGYIIANKKLTNFKKISEGPIIHKDFFNPYGASASYILKDKKKFNLYYCPIIKWIKAEHDYEMIYTIYKGVSDNLYDWKFEKKPLIKQKFSSEVISAPEVLKINGKYYMWYSYRDSVNKNLKKFKIGFAFSTNGNKWKRLDNMNIIKPSKIKSDWCYDSICYLSFFINKNKKYCFFSGNGTGKEGFGYCKII